MSTGTHTYSAQPWIEDGLLRRVRAGDDAAFSMMYGRYSRTLYFSILRMVRDASLAEDLVQEVFLKAWKAASTLDHSVLSLGPWLHTVARNQVLDYLRSSQNHQAARSAAIDCDALPSPFSLSLSDIFSQQQAQFVRAALGRLPGREQYILKLAYFEGLTQVEMAAQLQMPLGTVKSCVRNALRNLKEHLRRTHPNTVFSTTRKFCTSTRRKQ